MIHVPLASSIWAPKFWKLKFNVKKEYGERLLGKQLMMSFSKESSSRAKNPLELRHADVCGPIKPNSLGKNKYFLLFVNEVLRKT